jgi:hypothetical protein
MVTQRQAEKLAKKCTVNVRKWYDKKEYVKKSDKFLYTHGFNYQDIFNLDTSILAYFLPRLVYFRDNCTGYPTSLESYDAWIEILNKIIDGFYAYMEREWRVLNRNDRDTLQDQFDQSMQLFCKYFCSLWD